MQVGFYVGFTVMPERHDCDSGGMGFTRNGREFHSGTGCWFGLRMIVSTQVILSFRHGNHPQ